MNIFNSLKKSRRLWKVSKKLSGPSHQSYDIMKMMQGGMESQKALDDLIDIAYGDKDVVKVLESFSADKTTLYKIYHLLVQAGAGQYVQGHFIAASSLVYPGTVKYLLKHYKNDQLIIDGQSPNDSSKWIAYRLIKYFENNESGELF